MRQTWTSDSHKWIYDRVRVVISCQHIHMTMYTSINLHICTLAVFLDFSLLRVSLWWTSSYLQYPDQILVNPGLSSIPKFGFWPKIHESLVSLTDTVPSLYQCPQLFGIATLNQRGFASIHNWHHGGSLMLSWKDHFHFGGWAPKLEVQLHLKKNGPASFGFQVSWYPKSQQRQMCWDCWPRRRHHYLNV